MISKEIKVTYQLKDMFSLEVIEQLAIFLIDINSLKDQNKQDFISSIIHLEWPQKSLNERVDIIARSLATVLPDDFIEAIPHLEKLTEAYLKSGIKTQNYVCQFIPHYIALFGRAHPNESLELIEKVTELTSCEFVIRHFIISDTALTMAAINQWTKSKSENVRRLASEGCRPKLPWGIRLKEFVKDPSPLFPIIRQLLDDKSIYVRKSLANNLNDVAKDHPKEVIRFCAEMLNGTPHRQWIARNALRTLLKAGNKDALSLFNWHSAAIGKAEIKTMATTIVIGQSVDFQCGFELLNPTQNLRVELAVYFPRNRKEALRKVFQWGKTIENKNLTYSGVKTLKFENLSTRKMTLGAHKIELLVNGEAVATTEINLR